MNFLGPISYSRAMILALHAGRKSQTRRLIALPPVPDWHDADYDPFSITREGLRYNFRSCLHGKDLEGPVQNPHGKFGDARWIQEEHELVSIGPLRKGRREVTCHYLADGTKTRVLLTAEETDKLDSRRADPKRPLPGRFMYRSLSRSYLVITGVRPETLQSITDEDAWAEGCTPGERTDNGGFFPAYEEDPDGKSSTGWDCARDWYADLWDRLHPEHPFESDPLVWRITFDFRPSPPPLS